jgi:hypothetical protein
MVRCLMLFLPRVLRRCGVFRSPDSRQDWEFVAQLAEDKLLHLYYHQSSDLLTHLSVLE